MKRSLVFLLVLIAWNARTQTLTVLDNSDLQPIENVAIVNLQHSRTALTNQKGQANLSVFTPSDTLFFQHPSYQELILPFSALETAGYQVNLIQSTINLSEYVVSASKWEQKREEVPNRITSLKAKEVAYLNPQTTADLLGNSHEVFIQKSQLGGGSPMIRGFSANSVLIVVDGVRMNNAIYRSGNLQNIISIDPNTLEEAEVVFGPGSIIYGSDALGGVMDFHTRKITFQKEKKGSLTGQAMMRYSSANNEKTAHAEILYTTKRFGSYTSFSISDFDDLRMGSHGNDSYRRTHYASRNGQTDMMLENTESDIQKFSGYRQFNLTQKLAYKINEQASVDYGFHLANTSDIPRYDRLTEYDEDSTLKYADWYYGPQFWMMHTLGLNLHRSSGLFDDGRLTLAYQAVEESRFDRRFGNDNLRSRTEHVDVVSLNFDLDKKLSENSSLFYGLEGVYNHVTSSAETNNIVSGEGGAASTRYPDGGSNYSSAAAYINFKSNLHAHVTMQTGLRYSHIFANSSFIDTTFYQFPYSTIELNTGALNGSLGFVFRTSEKSRINLNLSSGFRAPNIDDLAKVFDSEPGNVVVPNENLKPEYTYNVDLGLIRSLGEYVQVELTGFYTFITNLMVRKDYQFNGQDSILYDGSMSQVQAFQNAASGWITGVSFDFRANITSRLGFKTNLTYMRGEDDEGEAIRHVTPFFGSTGLTYSAKKIKLDLWVDYNGSISYDRLAPTERNKPHIYSSDSNGNPYSPSWYTVNLKGFYQINKHLQVNAGIDNLLDNRYRPYSSGIAGPGRNFVLALRAGF